jgi:hypothetical protein
MNGETTARRLYLELTALFIDREIAKFRRGEQAALVSFSNAAKLARNASEELMAHGARERAERPMPALAPTCIGAAPKGCGR